MAQLQNISNPDRIAAWIGRKDPKQFTANTGRAATPRPLGQRSRAIRRQFSLPRDEFDGMAEAELWGYLDIMLDRIVDDVKEMKLRLGRKMQFYSFPTPVNTMNRAVNIYQKDGVFIAWRAVFDGIPRSEKTAQQIVDFEFTAEVALVGDEKGSPRE